MSHESSTTTKPAGHRLGIKGELLGTSLVLLAFTALIGVVGIQRAVAVIVDRLGMLREHCTTDLRTALAAVAHGDLTRTVTPVTPELERTSNDEIGDVAEAVAAIRANTVASVEAYNAMRDQIAGMIRQRRADGRSVRADRRRGRAHERAGLGHRRRRPGDRRVRPGAGPPPSSSRARQPVPARLLGEPGGPGRAFSPAAGEALRR